MKLLIFLSPLVFFGCGQTYNSNTFDRSIFSSGSIDISTAAGVRLKAAYDVLEQRCMNCHIHSGWADYVTSSKWIEQGLINSADSANSAIVYRLNNNGGDMPTTGYLLTPSELTTIETWINQL